METLKLKTELYEDADKKLHLSDVIGSLPSGEFTVGQLLTELWYIAKFGDKSEKLENDKNWNDTVMKLGYEYLQKVNYL